MNYTENQTADGRSPSIFRCLTGFLIAVMSFAALAATASAQTATITGRVLNRSTGEFLKYAQIQVVGTDRVAFSEDGGQFTLTNVPAGQAKLIATYTGLDPFEIVVTVPTEGSVTQEIVLTSAEYGETVKLGAFRVASAREGNAKAIVEQRVALNLKTVIAADAFGDVSEGNVGEFLKLLPGVSVDYVDNDARSARVRGLPPKYNTTTLDGHPIANAASSNIATGRQLELEQVSMAAMDIMETTKAPTSDMMTPNLAGNINAISKSAFSQQGRSIKYQGSYNFNQWNASFEKSKGWDGSSHSKALPNGKLEYIDTFFGGKLGLVASIAHTGSFAEQRIVIGTNGWDTDATNNNTELPNVTTWNFQHGLKPTWRDSLLLNLDYKATDELMLSLRTTYGYYRSEFYNRNWLVNTATGASITNKTETSATNLTATNNSSSNYARVAGSNQRKSGGTFITNPAVNWKRDNIKVDAGVSYSQAKNAYTSGQDGYFSLVQADMRGLSYSYNRLADDNVAITQLANGTGSVVANTGSFLDLGNYNSAGSVNSERRNSKDQMWTANADVEIAFPDWNIPTTFKFGAADSLEVRDISNFKAAWNMALTNSAPSSATAINLQDYREAFSGGVGTVTDRNGVTSKTPAPDKWALYRLFQSYGNTDPLALTANGPFTAQTSNNLRNLLQNQFDLKENIGSAYAMATVKPIKKLSLIGGLRFEKTKTEGRSFDDKGGYATLAKLGYTTAQIGSYNNAGTYVPGSMTAAQKTAVGTTGAQFMDYIYYRYGSSKTRENNYNNVLPVFQARYEVSKNLITRVAYYGSLLRPDFQNVVGGITTTDKDDGSYGFSLNNAEVKPETANNFDVSIEYYFEPVGLISATIFYKDIKNIQVNQPGLSTASAPVEVRSQLLEAGYTESDLNNPSSTYSTIINGPKTSLMGLELAYSQELSFLPGALKGLGVTVNYSHYKPEEERLWALVPNGGDGMPLDQANFILRYKKGKFSAQGSVTWTGKRIMGSSGSTFGILGLQIDSAGNFVPSVAANSNVTAYQAARTVVSMSMEYEVHRFATLFMGVNNLLNSAKYNYQERSIYTTRNGTYGASINVGVKGSF